MIIVLFIISITSLFTARILELVIIARQNAENVRIDFKKAWEQEELHEISNQQPKQLIACLVKNEQDNIAPTLKFVGHKVPKAYLDNNGYWRFIDSNRLVHRYSAQKAIGRKLKYGEVVHHIDGNKWNNRPNNLYVCSWEKHNMIHRENFYQYGNWYGAKA